jgi:hypothetical protein
MATRDRQWASPNRTNRSLLALFVAVSALSFLASAPAAPKASAQQAPAVSAAERHIAALAVVPTSVPKAPINVATVKAEAAVAGKASQVAKLAIPANGAYLGAWIDPQAANCGGTCLIGNDQQFESQIGRKLAILSEYLGWGDSPNLANLQALNAEGAVPLISQHCNTALGAYIPDSQINAGLYDGYIALFAGQLATLKFPVLYRWMWEENNYTEKDQFQTCLGVEGPAGYIAAWQRIWTIFQQAGATNVSFVWNPSASVSASLATGCSQPPQLNPFTGQHYPTIVDYWPGSQFVDWGGFDFYDARTVNPPPGLVHPDDFSGVTNPGGGTYAVQCAYSVETAMWPTLPLLVGETAAPNGPQAPSTQQMYINDIATNAATVRPQVKAIVWFDVNTGKENWTFTPAGESAFAALGASPYFSPMWSAPTSCPVGANQNLSGTPRAIVTMTTGPCQGYSVATTSGEVTVFGAAGYYGDLRSVKLNAPIVAMAATPDGQGYWLLGYDGGVFSFGDAVFYGSTGGLKLNQPIISMASTPDGGGYWLVARDGGVFAFGDAQFYGSTGGLRLNAPIIGISPSLDGAGYRLVATDGGIFAFGDAPFEGSMGGTPLNKPVIGMTTDPASGGYRLVALDGGVFNFGGAANYGSLGGQTLAAPIVSLAPTVLGNGYYMLGADGGVFAFNAPALGRVFG